jgi:hypothetical protein
MNNTWTAAASGVRTDVTTMMHTIAFEAISMRETVQGEEYVSKVVMRIM